MIRTLGEKFVQFNMADNTVGPSVDWLQSMDKKLAGCKIELTPPLISHENYWVWWKGSHYEGKIVS